MKYKWLQGSTFFRNLLLVFWKFDPIIQGIAKLRFISNGRRQVWNLINLPLRFYPIWFTMDWENYLWKVGTKLDDRYVQRVKLNNKLSYTPAYHEWLRTGHIPMSEVWKSVQFLILYCLQWLSRAYFPELLKAITCHISIDLKFLPIFFIKLEPLLSPHRNQVAK